MDGVTRPYGERRERQRRYWGGLRGRFIALVLVALLPIVCSIFWATWETNQAAEREGGELALVIAEEFAEEYADALNRTEAAMRHMLEFEATLVGEFPACHGLFKSIVAQHTFLTNAWMTNADGLQLCNDGGADRFNRADRPDFLRARETGKFSPVYSRETMM